MAMQTAATLIPGVVNHRIGRVAGDGGLERIVRTFHARFGSVKMGGAMTARDRLAYVFREGKHKSDAADVESSAGDKEALLRDADRIKASARVRRGPTAERILATQIVELPAESTAEQRKACAEAFVADWKARGHEAVAVVHMHGEEGPQPHLHVEVAARAVDADGGVDRSTALWTGPHGRQAVQAERRRNADLVNRTCDPDPPYHPGNFRDIGIERPAKKRIPPRPFREARTRSREERADLRPTIDEARALGHERRVNRLETALANGAAQMYAVSAEKRAPLHEAHEQHRGKIEAAKAVGAWPPPPLRERLKQLGAIEREAVKKEVGLLEKQRDEAAAAAAKREKELKNAAIAIAAGAGEQLEARERQRKSAEWRAGELKTQRDAANNRATAAKASVTTLTDEKQQAETRADTAGRRARELEELNKRQTKYVTDWHGNRKVELPDLATVEGQSAAWANMRAWEAKALKKARDEAGAALTAATTAEKERDEQRLRADTAEDRVATLKAEKQAAGAELATAKKERADAKNETAALRAHSAEQTEFLTGVHRERGRDLPDLETGEGRSEAWAFARTEMESGRAARRREAAAEEKRKEGEAARQQALAEEARREVERQRLAVQSAQAAGPPAADLAAARAHVFTRHPYTGTTADDGVDDPLAVDGAGLRGQRKHAARMKNEAARQQTRDRRPVFREDGRHAAVLWAQRLVDIEVHAVKRGIELAPTRSKTDKGRGESR